MTRWGRWLPLVIVLVIGLIAMSSVASDSPTSTSLAAAAASSTTAASLATPTTTPSVVSTTSAPVTTTTVSTPATSLPIAENPYGGVATVGVVATTTTLNPFIARSALSEATGVVMWASAFVLSGDTYELGPGVLTQVPSRSNGGIVDQEDGSVVVTLEIDPQARWEDGRPITAADLGYTADVLASDLRIDRDIRDRHRLITNPEETGLTYRFTLTAPTIEFLEMFQVILPAHQMQGTDLFSDWDDQPWLSAGPFRFAGRAEDGSVLLERNENYWKTSESGDALPYLDGLTVVTVPDHSGIELGLADRILSLGDLGTEYGPIRGRDDLVVVTAPGQEWEHVGFQFGDGRFAANPRSLVASPSFRALVAVVVGDNGLVGEIGGSDLFASDSVVASSWPAAASPQVDRGEAPTLDVIADEMARDFVEQPPTVVYSTATSLDRSQMAGVALRELAARGVAVDVQIQDAGLFFRDSVIAGDFEVAEWAWTITPGPVGAVRDVQDWFGTSPSRDGLDFYRWSQNTESEALLADIAAVDMIMDLDELRAALQSIDGRLLERSVVVPLWQNVTGAGYDPARLAGYIQPRFGVPVTWNAAEWLVPGGCADVPDGAVCGGVILPDAAG